MKGVGAHIFHRPQFCRPESSFAFSAQDTATLAREPYGKITISRAELQSAVE
jgi:hypothetical protein